MGAEEPFGGYGVEMVLKQLAYLVALARERHFGRAALAANVSQPTLSAAIRQLEGELGVPIVERGHRFERLTPEGQVVVEHAKRMLAEVADLEQTLADMRGGLSGRLRFGAIPTALPVISLLTAPFYARYPKVTVTLLSMTSDAIQRGITDYQLEAGLTYLDNEPLEHVRAKPIYAEEYLFLTRADGPFGGRSHISWSEAAETPLCLLTPDMQNRRIIDGIFRSIGKAPRPAMETNSIFNLCSHPSTGEWSSIVPAPILRFFGIPSGTTALELVEPRTSRTVGLVISDREPALPLSRSLFAISEPLDLTLLASSGRLIAPAEG